MSIERDLISKILQTRDLTVSSDAGITPAFFLNSDHREAYKFILEHHREYNQVPTEEAFKRNYPSYRIDKAEDALQYYADEVSKQYFDYLLEDALVQATDLFDDGDPVNARNTMAACLTRLNQETSRTKVTDITQTGEERLERYREYSKAGGALKGISTGFPSLDYATGGMQPGQLFVFVGPPKAGKSTMMLLSSLFAHMAFYRPLFCGFEMSNSEQEERHDAIRAKVSHQRLREGRLSAEEFRELEKMTRRLDMMPAYHFSADTHATSTLSGLSSMVEKHDPHVLYVDGMYLMQDEEGEKPGSPQALTNLTRGFKRMAQNRDIPVAISSQVLLWKMDRKRGVTMNSIGYSSSFAQDADVLVSVEPTDDHAINKIKIIGGRNVKNMEVFVKWDWETGEFEELEGAEDDEEAATKF